MSTGKKRKRKKSRAAALQNRLALAAIFGVVAVILIVFLVIGNGLRRQIRANEQTAKSLSEAIEKEESRTDSIESMRDALSTESFVRDAAKERLGLVESGEILFKAEN